MLDGYQRYSEFHVHERISKINKALENIVKRLATAVFILVLECSFCRK